MLLTRFEISPVNLLFDTFGEIKPQFAHGINHRTFPLKRRILLQSFNWLNFANIIPGYGSFRREVHRGYMEVLLQKINTYKY